MPNPSRKTWTLGLRTATVLLGTTLLVYGAMPAQFQQGLSVFRALEWGAVSAVVIRVAECSRWFFTVVQATRDLHRRW